MLKVDKLNVHYGGLQALWDVTLEVDEKQIVTVIGSNGAGKTTLLKTISGVLRPTSGLVEFDGQKLHLLPPHKICEIGVIHIPEGRKIFPLMRVRENLEMGAYLPGARKHFKDSLDWVFQLFPFLKKRQNQLAGTLSGGEQQMLALARGLMSRPRLLMLDEPSLGLSPKLAMEITRNLKLFNEQGIALLLISQEVLQCLRLAQKGYVLENGRITLQGSCNELLQNVNIKKSYLGL